MIGTVLSGTNNVFDVECEDGVQRRCSLKGKKLKTAKEFYNPLAPGDRVELELDSIDNERAQILCVQERKNSFLRWNVKGRLPQLLAANLDYIMLVTTPDMPPFRPRFIDRALSQAEQANIEPVIIINKCDLPFAPETDARIADWERIGYRCMKISAKSGDGLREFALLLEDKLTAFVGHSGVGKSSLVNVLDSTCVLKTGSLSEKYGRGNHTTTKGVLMRLTLNEALTGRLGARASIIDTPGVRRFVLNGIPKEDLAFYFKEMKHLVGTCAFGMSCSHTNEAGCAVQASLSSGAISPERYESFVRIAEEIETGNWAD
jgi:ribosome biogenesis GTPase